MITVSGTTPTETGSITDLNVSEATIGQPIAITTTFKNTGNYHYYGTSNIVTVTDAQGKDIANATSQPSNYAIIPGNTVQYIVTPDVNLPAGTYTVDSKVALANGNVLDKKTTTFTVQTNYVPPPTETNITVSPGSPATLTSPDGRYSVSFPQGAVIGDVVVTLKPYSKNQLPSAPSGAKLGATCFEITGLSGLLSKDATVKVTYSADDLAAAGGDASQLKLSYFDAAQNTWVILPTQVNTGSTTLTTTTNHLSIWAVMVSSSTTTGGTASVTAPAATSTKSPLSLTVILASLIIAGIAVGKSARKRK
jgi:methionine-rich copper-binding protein CopC